MAYFHHLLLVLNILLLCLLALSGLTFSAQPQHAQPRRIPPYIIDYGNGTVVRDRRVSTVPPPNNSQVQSKDIIITSSLRARLFLPAQPDPARRLPILIYFHGGAFCIGSAFDQDDTVFLARLAARARVLAVAVEYRLYPDAPIPAPYDDAWAALEWVTAHRPGGRGPEPWLGRYGDSTKVFAGGDSAGGNIAHNLAVQAGRHHGTKLEGIILAMPYFLGSKRVPLEPASITQSPNYKIWAYVCPNCKGGVDNGYINPVGFGAPSLISLGCKRLLVYTAEIDELRGRGRWYYQRVKRSGWKGQAKLLEAKGKGHVFHILNPDDPGVAKLIHHFSKFLNA